MKKALVVTSVASMVDQFLIPSIRILQASGYEVRVACNFKKGNTCSDERIEELRKRLDEQNVVCKQIDFERNITKVSANLLAYKQIKNLISINEYDIVHCHSPIGGVIARIACRKARKDGTKVIYTAHGFHFFKGAPLKNWLIYYPVERLLAPLTDCLITINQEDYKRAKSFRLGKSKRVEYVPGVGIDINRFKKDPARRDEIRKELGITDNEILLLSVGEINQNKNHKLVIEALAKLGRKDIRYVVCGVGPLMETNRLLVHSLGLENQVVFVGYRTDVINFYQAADLFSVPSFREGLPVAPMEAMAAGLPCIASKIRGNVDLFSDSELLFDPHDINCLCEAIKKATDPEIASRETERNTQTLQRFSTEEVIKAMKGIYAEVVSK